MSALPPKATSNATYGMSKSGHGSNVSESHKTVIAAVLNCCRYRGLIAFTAKDRIRCYNRLRHISHRARDSARKINYRRLDDFNTGQRFVRPPAAIVHAEN